MGMTPVQKLLNYQMKLFVILFAQIGLSYNSDNNCGCSFGRETQKSFNSMFNTHFMPKYSDEFKQCPLKSESNLLRDHSKITEYMSLIPGGEYQIGTDDMVIVKDKEGPKRLIKLKSFFMDKFEVSNRDFQIFTNSTQYLTEAETFGDTFVFTLFLNSTFKEQLVDLRVLQAPWWYKVSGASWKYPQGPDSSIEDHMDHPVTHVSWRDAKAYCSWRKARLPTEAEWEAACRGGKRDTIYPWGNKLFPNKTHMANIWQGSFPNHNSKKDGYIGTNPVTMFPPNDFGLYNMAGNVWEWTEDTWNKQERKEKVKKGGSYLCHKSYCYRYRCSARSHNTEDSSAGNLGFRCAKSV